MTSTSAQKQLLFHNGASPQEEPVTALHASNYRFRVIFDAVVDGIFLTDPATSRVTEVNAAGCAMFGYEKEELIGLDIATLSSGIYPYTQKVSQATTSQSTRGDVRMMEWQCRKKNGTLFWAELSKHYPIAEVSKRLGVSQHSLYAWKRKFVKASGSGDDDQAAEIRRLKRELARMTEERDILKKATAYFAKDAK
jgi:transposase